MTLINGIISLVLIKNYFTVHYMDIDIPSLLTENIDQLREIGEIEENWDGEGGLSLGKEFIQELIDLVSIMQIQPDIGVTGRGSVDFEYGSRKKGQRYQDLEVFEKDRRVKVYSKDGKDRGVQEEITMDDIQQL